MRLSYIFVLPVYLLNCLTNAETEDVTVTSSHPHQRNTVAEESNLTDFELEVPTEETIGKDGHISGMKPLHYDLQLRFENETHYSGVANVWMKVVQKTKYIMVNVKPNSPNPDFNAIVVSIVNADNALEEVSLQQIYLISFLETLVIELKLEIPIGTYCLVTFGSFKSSAFDEKTGVGANGLFLSSEHSHSVLHTLFQNRSARSVFPCMDQPSLKASFQLIIDAPKDYDVVSSTQPDEDTYQLNGTNLIRRRFKQTPNISTSAFSFALMRNYYQFSNNKYPKFRIWTTQNDTDRWQRAIIHLAENAFHNLNSMIKFQLPLEKLDYILVDGIRFGDEGNIGMISLKHEETNTYNSSREKHRLVHNVAHLWIGGVVTLVNWNELCLYEALTSYLELLVMKKINGFSLSRWARNTVRRHVNHYYSSLLWDRENNAEFLGCHRRGPLVFHMIAQMYGTRSIESFVSNLVNAYAFGNAGLEECDSVLSNSLANDTAVKGYLRSWFTEPGPLTLIIYSTNDSMVKITQHLTDQIQSTKPALLKVYISTSAEPVEVIFNKDTYSMFLYGSSWLIVDPDQQTLTRKLYSSDLYWQLFKTPKYDPEGHLNDKRLEAAADEFCAHVLDNSLPLPNDDNPDTWTEILRLVLQIGGLDARCGCCIIPAHFRSDNCFRYLDECGRLRLIRMLNR